MTNEDGLDRVRFFAGDATGVLAACIKKQGAERCPIRNPYKPLENIHSAHFIHRCSVPIAF